MPASRRGSGSVILPSGQTIAIHTRTQDEEDLPHATKRYALVIHTPPGQPCWAARNVHALVTFCVILGRWRTISGNTRHCQSCLLSFEITSD